MSWTADTRRQIASAADLLGAALDLDVTRDLGLGPDPRLAELFADRAGAVDPLLIATNQGTAAAALDAGDPGQLLCAVVRALAQVAQIDAGGVRP